MFTAAIKDVPLTDELASELFTNINADSFDGDATFCATLRYLLFEKLQPYESVNVKLSINETETDCFVVPFPLERDTIYICALKRFSAEGFARIRTESSLNMDEFVYQEQATHYLTQPGCKAHVFINENNRTTIVFTQSMTMKFWHKIQSALTRLLPWHFSASIDDSVRAFLHTLTKKDFTEYMKYITTFANKLNFHEDRLNKLLRGFGLSYEKIRVEKLKSDQIANMEEYKLAQEKIKNCITKERNLFTVIAGIEELLAKGDDTGLADYFICNRCLNLVGVNNDELSYVVTTYFNYFDQTVFEKFIQNPKSYFFEQVKGVAADRADYIKLLFALFGDNPVLRIRTAAEFKMSLSGSLVGIRDSEKLASYPDWLPHPHIDSTHCLGTNEHYINDLMMSKRYIEAIEQTIAATMNISFSDSTVAKKLVTQIQISKKKFIELPTGEVVTPDNALKWLKEQEENKID